MDRRPSRGAAWWALIFASIAVPWGCSAQSEPLSVEPSADAGADASVAPAWTLELEADVAPGDEETVCRYFVVPQAGLSVARFAHSLSDRTHHLLLFPT